MQLTPSQHAFWQEYLDRLAPDEHPTGAVIADCPGSPDIADDLIDLYLAGRKTAGSGLLAAYKAEGDPLPQVGDHWLALDARERPRCILRTRRLETHRFDEAPERIAVAEGEGDRSLDHWRRAHAEHFRPHLTAWGIDDLDAAVVVTEFFDLVHR